MESSIREAIVTAAFSQLGNTDPSRYWLAVLDPPQAHPVDAKGRPLFWCGAGALWCLQQAGAARGVHWVPGRGFIFMLKPTRSPKVGDIAYRDRPYQHHAVVVRFDGTTVDTIDFNAEGGTVVRHCNTPIDKWTSIYDVEPLLPKAPEAV